MLIALNNKGIRVKPFKGGLGKCQSCNNDVRAYCGEINIHHWRHIDSTQCDSWKENETEWHREWKGIFPIDWQEVIINKNEQIHRADIKTPNGLVVEFQNSSISSTDVKKREYFYGNMIWLINAEKFKENIVLWSKVKEELKYHQQQFDGYYYSFEDSQDSLIVEKIKDKISKIENKLRSKNQKIERIKNSLNEVIELKTNIKLTTRDFLKSYYGYFSPLKEFKSDVKDDFKNSEESLKTLKESLIKQKELLKLIDEFEKCPIKEFKDFSIVEYKQINSKHFRICKMIKKESINSLFVEVVNFNSAHDFDRMARNSDYLLIMDFSSIITKITLECEVLKETILENRIQKKEQKKQLKKLIHSFLRKEKKEKESRLIKLNLKKDSIVEKLENKVAKLVSVEYQENIDESISMEKALKSHEKEKFDIMKSYKGLYGYNWKYRRKTWDFANKPIYLDYGNSIFKMLSESRLKKISNLEFVNLVNDWRPSET